MKKHLPILLLTTITLLSGCQNVYYKTMESFGKHKRDLLVDRVEDARNAQEQTKEQFASALEQFTTVLNYDGGPLQEKYDTLNDAYQKSKAKAAVVTKRIKQIEKVSQALFDEWEAELEEYSSNKLRRASYKKLNDTRGKYTLMIDAMQRAESKMAPVLAAFKDQVLYLKHNLNAQAIASLQDELLSVESDIALLIKEMETSIAEANKFIKSMES